LECNTRRGVLLDTAMKGEPLKGAHIIDCHAHLGPYNVFHIPHNDAEGMLKPMDKMGVQQACISAIASIGPDYKLGNDLVAKAVKEHPERFIGYAVVNPNYPWDMEAELKRCFRELGMRAIKLHTELHGYPIDGPNYRPALEYANSNRLVVLSHGWGSPETLERLSQEYPGANLIVAHGGAWNGRSPNRILQIAKTRSNVFLDTAGSLVYLGGLEQLVKEVGAEKVLYGSDFPFQDSYAMMGGIIYAKISDEDKEKILGLNTANLLKTSG